MTCVPVGLVMSYPVRKSVHLVRRTTLQDVQHAYAKQVSADSEVFFKDFCCFNCMLIIKIIVVGFTFYKCMSCILSCRICKINQVYFSAYYEVVACV